MEQARNGECSSSPTATNNLFPHTVTLVGGGNLGEGILHVGAQALEWKPYDLERPALCLRYEQIATHSTCKATAELPHPCIMCLVEDDGDLETITNDCASASCMGGSLEIRFVPADPSQLQQVYNAITECQKLHPDEPGKNGCAAATEFINNFNDDDAEDYDDMDNDGNDDSGDDFFGQVYNLSDEPRHQKPIVMSDEGLVVMQRLAAGMNVTGDGFDDAMLEYNMAKQQFDDAE